jgi:hypothetical protein
MNLKKTLLALGTAAMATGLVGCFGDDDSSGGVDISGFEMDADGTFAGSVTSSDELTGWSFEIKDAEGVASDVEVSYLTLAELNEGEEEAFAPTDLSFGSEVVEGIVPLSALVDTDYLCKGDVITFTAMAGDAKESASVTVDADGSECGGDVGPVVEDAELTSKTAELGSKTATEPSSIDLDSWTTYSLGKLSDAGTMIDLVYGTADSKDYLATPNGMRDLGLAADVSSAINESVLMFPVTMTATEFAAAEKVSDLPDFGEIDAVEKVEASEGTTVVIATDKFTGEGFTGLFLVRVEAQTPGSAGKVSIKALTEK